MTELLGRYTDEQWLALLVRSIREETIDGLKFPRFPPNELRSPFTRETQTAITTAGT